MVERQVLATGVVAERAAGILVTDLGQMSLRNVIESVRLFELDFGLRPDAAIDPVCRMLVRTSAAAVRVQMRGTEFLFCGLDCAAKFAGAPDRYTGAPHEACQRA